MAAKEEAGQTSHRPRRAQVEQDLSSLGFSLAFSFSVGRCVLDSWADSNSLDERAGRIPVTVPGDLLKEEEDGYLRLMLG